MVDEKSHFKPRYQQIIQQRWYYCVHHARLLHTRLISKTLPVKHCVSGSLEAAGWQTATEEACLLWATRGSSRQTGTEKACHLWATDASKWPGIEQQSRSLSSFEWHINSEPPAASPGPPHILLLEAACTPHNWHTTYNPQVVSHVCHHITATGSSHEAWGDHLCHHYATCWPTTKCLEDQQITTT